MRKMLFGLVLVACFASMANAQLNLFYDARPTTAEIIAPAPPYTNSASLCYYAYAGIGQNDPRFNAGGKGDAQMIWVSPQIHDIVDAYGGTPGDGYDENFYSWSYGALDYSLGSFYLYADFTAPAGNVVSSIGVTQAIPAAAFAAGSAFFLDYATTTVVNAGLWSGNNLTGSNASTSMKYVQVPVSAGPPVAFNPAAGIGPGAFQQIAKVDVRGAYRVATQEFVGTYGVKLSVNSLLCTQVNAGGTAGNLAMNLGYYLGSPDPLTSGTGSTNGATSANDDMTIVVVRKGDFDLDGAAATSIDNIAWLDIVANQTPVTPNWNAYEQYLGDFDVDGVPCTNVDLAEYLKHVNIIKL